MRISVFNKEEKWSEGFGELKKANLRIQAASISKTITALTILSLIEDKAVVPKGDKGLFTLDTNIKDILDDDLWKSISNGQDKPITIRQLMAHTAGLEGESDTGFRGYYRDKESEIKMTKAQISDLENEQKDEEKLQSLENKEKIESIAQHIKRLKKAVIRAEKRELPSLDEILKGEGTNSPPVQVTEKPGHQFAYSGGGAMILQKVIEIVSKQQSYDAVVDERVFKKLKMDHSGFNPEEHLTVKGYGKDGNPLPGDWMQQPELAAAGLWSTPEDLTKVAKGIQASLKNEGLLSKDSAEAMITPYFEKEISNLKKELELLDSKKDGERIDEIQKRLKMLQEKEVPGLGVFIEKTKEATYFYHSGSNLGFRCLMIANDQGQGAVIMTNSETGIDLIPEVVRKIAEVYDWKGRNSFSSSLIPPLHPEVVETHRKRKAIDPKTWFNDHKGTYRSDKNSDIEVKVYEENGEIYFKSPGPAVVLTPVSKNVGIVKEDGRWFPVEFSNENSVLSIHGMTHTKMNQEALDKK